MGIAVFIWGILAVLVVIYGTLDALAMENADMADWLLLAFGVFLLVPSMLAAIIWPSFVTVGIAVFVLGVGIALKGRLR